MNNKIDSLQFVRAFAAIWVLITHVFQYLDIKPLGNYYLSGQYGVDVFFILSGFIIYLTTKDGTLWKHFFTKRVFRVFPAYLFCLVGYWLYFYLIHSERVVCELWGGVQNLLLFPCSDRILPSSLIVGQAWSTCYEMYFYIVMTTVLLFGARKKKILLVLGTLFIFVWLLRGWLRTFGFGRYLFSLLGSIHIYKFCIGILVAMFYEKLLVLFDRFKMGVVVKWMVFSLLQVIVVAIFFMSYRHYVAPVASIIMFLSWLLMNQDLIIYSDKFIYKLVKWLGDISYSIYLVHLLLINIFINQCHICRWWLLLPIALVATIGVSACMYRFIEKPGMDLAKQIVKKNR